MKTNDLAAAILGFLLILVGFVAYIAAMVWFRAVALVWLWVWFIVPLGAPAIGFWHAAGLSVFVGFFTARVSSKIRGSDDKEKYTAMILPFTYTLAALGFGYLIQLFM